MRCSPFCSVRRLTTASSGRAGSYGSPSSRHSAPLHAALPASERELQMDSQAGFASGETGQSGGRPCTRARTESVRPPHTSCHTGVGLTQNSNSARTRAVVRGEVRGQGGVVRGVVALLGG
jgi:hypothetical protein